MYVDDNIYRFMYIIFVIIINEKDNKWMKYNGFGFVFLWMYFSLVKKIIYGGVYVWSFIRIDFDWIICKIINILWFDGVFMGM